LDTAAPIARDKLYTYTRARPPSRTLVDPLSAFVDAIPQGFDEAVAVAQHIADATKDMEAKAGRSTYLDAERLRNERVPDPGAWGVGLILGSLHPKR